MKLKILALIMLASTVTASRGPGEWLERLRKRMDDSTDQVNPNPQTKFEKPVIGQEIFPTRGISGYVGVTDDPVKNQMFYWYFDSLSDKINDPLLIWLTGGPGCSSELALAFENGPWFLIKDSKSGETSLQVNPNSWNQKANLLFIDQPIGTGYSFGEKSKYATNQDMVKAYFVQFIEAWLNLDQFKRFKGHPLYISGESYAGHYIPQVGNALYFRQIQNPDINLKGLAIGNGWMTPKSQDIAKTQYFADNKTQFKLTDTTLKQVTNQGTLCAQEYGNWNPMRVIDSDTVCGNAVPAWVNSPQFNPYDITPTCVGDLCYDFGYYKTFFNRADVKQELGITKETWELCDNGVGGALYQDESTDSMLNLTPLIEGGLPVLFYTGMNDYICNWRGTEQVLKDFKWSGQSTWNSIKNYSTGPWGDFKEYKNLKFIKIANSGHMVPHDQGVIALGMINDFLASNKQSNPV